MLFEYAIPVALGVVVYYFADEFVYGRRFGPITDVSRSSETGGLAFRALGLLLVGVGAVKFLRTVVPW